MTRFAMFDSVDLPDGARGAIVQIYDAHSPPAYEVEVFNSPGSMGDGVVTMRQDGDRLVPTDPAALAAILQQAPNVDRTARV